MATIPRPWLPRRNQHTALTWADAPAPQRNEEQIGSKSRTQ
ncbi:hypothetical protein [Actinomyces oris]|nr:hypothetical protein [Actinomyces oris]